MALFRRRFSELRRKHPASLNCCGFFCGYSDHGHSGVVSKKIRGNDDVDNDNTLKLLVAQATSLVRAGADVIAPSGMMDGMLQAIRRGLDHLGFIEIPVLSYAVKYASSFYGPFREAELDIAEGADFLTVKPA